MLLQDAMDKNNNNTGKRWSLFGGGSSRNNNNENSNPAINVVGGDSGPNNRLSNNVPTTSSSNNGACVDSNRNDSNNMTMMRNQIQSLNDCIASLQSDIVLLSSKQKEESYIQKKKIVQLEGENEALALQNVTLEKLSRFHNDG